MRLICPNCGAQYEIPDDVIAPEGRDVQCSNCGHTWLERPGASEAAELGLPEPEYEADLQSADPTPEPEPEPAPPEPQPEPEAEDDTPPPARRRELDPAIADILKQEAEREREHRQSEADAGLESQPELGVEDAPSGDDQRAEEARRRMARLRGEQALPTASSASAARRDLLPDIEEINSSLRSTAERGKEPGTLEDVAPARRSSFRTGFALMIILAAIGLAIYTFAGDIALRFPQTESYLTAYVEAVNEMRLWLDLKMQDIMGKINGFRSS